MADLLSIGEAADVLQVTPRRLRYFDVGASKLADGGRVFDAEGLALAALHVRIAALFRRWELPPWKARAAVLYLEPEIRTAFARRGASFVVLNQWRGTAAVSCVSPGDVPSIPLRPLLDEMRQAIAERRADVPEVWTGREWSDEPELLTV